MQRQLLIAVSLVALCRAQTVTVDTLVNDMILCSEAKPHGLYADWADCPRKGWGNSPRTDWFAMIPWGVVYETRAGNAAPNTRVQLRNIAAYYLSKTDTTWRLWTKTLRVEGAAYLEDFAGDASKNADTRNEPDGTISVKAGEGYNFHFWSTGGRVTIDPRDIMGVYAICEARLIVENPSLPDDRSAAAYIVSMGADYWRSLTAGWAADWSNNGDIGIGRFKYVTSSWRTFTMQTSSAAQLNRTPPPGVAPGGSTFSSRFPAAMIRSPVNASFGRCSGYYTFTGRRTRSSDGRGIYLSRSGGSTREFRPTFLSF